MRSLWAAGLLLRRARVELGSLILLFLVIATTAFLFAAAPRLFNREADDGLRTAVRTATAGERDVRVAQAARIPPGSEGVAGPSAAGDRVAKTIPSSVAAIVSGRTMVLSSVRMDLLDRFDQTRLSLRYQEGLTEVTRLVAGRWPEGRGEILRPMAVGTPGIPVPDDQKPPPVIVEVALSTHEAAAIGVALGDRAGLALDRTDSLIAGTAYGIAPLEVEVVGLFEPIDETADVWSGDTSLLETALSGNPLAPYVDATAYISPAAYPDLFPSGLPFRYEWRFHVDPDRIDPAQVDAIDRDLERLTHTVGPSTGRSGGAPEIRTGLPAILERMMTQRAVTAAALSVAALGPLVLASGAIATLVILLQRGRRAGLTLARGRGASPVLVLGTELWEAILVAGTAAVLGLVLAVDAIPARDSPLSELLALGIAGVSIAVLLVVAWRATRGPIAAIERDDPRTAPSPRRLVVELTVVGIALGGAALLSQRGVIVKGAGEVPTFDPLLAAAPALIGLAAGIVALRLVPLPLRGLGWLAARRRDAVPVLGLRTTARDPGTSSLSLLVLMLTAAFGAFSSVITSTVDGGLDTASYLAVGADYRVEAPTGSLPPSSAVAAIPGVEAVAPAVVDGAATFISNPSQLATTYLDAVDAPAYAKVAAGSAAQPDWPSPFLAAPPSTGAGTDATPIPAILSSHLPIGSADLAPGDRFTIDVGSHRLTFQLVQRRATFPGIGNPTSFAVVPLDWVRAALPGGGPVATTMWLRAPAASGAAIATAVAAGSSGARVTSRVESRDELEASSLISMVAGGYGLAQVVAASYMALATVGAIVLSAPRRSRDLAYLRTLGISRRQALGLTVVEHGPTMLLALVLGVGLGVGLAVVLEPALGLDAFAGLGGAPPSIDGVSVGAMVAALVVVIVGALAAGTWLSRRARLMDALRIGEA